MATTPIEDTGRPSGNPAMRAARLTVAVRANWTLPMLTLLATALHVWGLTRGNTHYYYSAAVRSMSEDWSNFAFGAFDRAGSITLDKLPGAFWLQALAVRVLGYHDWVMLLPGTVAAIVTVPMLYLTVRRWAGSLAGIVAAVFLLVSPVTFAAAQVNLADPLLAFLLVAAAYTLTRAIDDGPRWLIFAAVLVGAAFQVKMLQSWLVMPAFVAAYAVGSPAPFRARAVHLSGFVVGTATLSLSWIGAVALIPAARRPYLDGSTTNSPWQMVFSYNGFSRAGGDQGPMAVPFGGVSGPLRLLNEQFGGQVGWMLPFAIVVAFAGAVLTPRAQSRVTAGWVLWGGWLLVAGASISATRGAHPYYATMLTPAIAALAGGGLIALATETRYRRPCDLVLLSALTVAAVTATIQVGRVESVSWTMSLVAVIVTLTIVSVVAVIVRRPETQVTVLAVVVVAVGPAGWIVASPAIPPSSALTANPVAGPQTTLAVYGTEAGSAGLTMMFGTPPGSPPPPVATPLLGTTPDGRLLEYLEREYHGEKYLFAVGDASSAATYIAAGHSVLPMGGFTASMPYPTATGLAELVDSRQLRFVLLIPMPGTDGPSGTRQAWVAGHCSTVDPRTYDAAPSYTVLYDCAQSSTPTASAP
ncbi:ArnT family glycosyltransferase [Nocardia sp. IBHARD005]|uniref:ArnT family glycosyltransferase n=1 Tax=Nocardia sp. IBHARD005 TaxID=3457765 RepID=UPI00405975F3